MRSLLRILLLTSVALGAASCLTIEQGTCPAGQAVCVDGEVWACTVDGSGWAREVRCPGSCQDGRCVLPDPPPLPDSSASPSPGAPDAVPAG